LDSYKLFLSEIGDMETILREGFLNLYLSLDHSVDNIHIIKDMKKRDM